MGIGRREVLKVAGWLVAACLPWREARAQRRFALSGEVLDLQNKPISSVLVSAYRTTGEKIGESTTGSDGKYQIEYPADSPIQTVRYERTGYDPGVVENLSGARAHTINKWMYLTGSKLSPLDAQASLAALERIYYLEASLKTPIEKVRATYREALEKMMVPPELAERRSFVLRLYRLG